MSLKTIDKRRMCLAIVDDSATDRAILKDFLRMGYDLIEAVNGREGLDLVLKELPDLVLLDMMMPEMGGIEVCTQLKENPVTRDIPVIFLTSMEDLGYKKKAFDAGAADYVVKPFLMEEVSLRIKNVLSIYQAKHLLADQNRLLNEEVLRRTKEIENTKNVMIRTLAALAETRDNDTGEHIIRTQHYVRLLAQTALEKGVFREELSPDIINSMYRAVPLHDIGKVGIRDNILLKEGKLTPVEFEIMKSHTTLGLRIMEVAERDLGPTPFMCYAKDVIISHHEKWDGSGYPHGLKGDDIPLIGRFMALADIYDAMISRRIYKEPMSHSDACEMIQKARDTHFDPRVVDCFVAAKDGFRRIAGEFSDVEVTPESLYGSY